MIPPTTRNPIVSIRVFSKLESLLMSSMVDIENFDLFDEKLMYIFRGSKENGIYFDTNKTILQKHFFNSMV